MSISVGEIFATLSLKDQLTQGLKVAEAQLAKTGKSLQEMGRAATEAGQSLTIGITAPLVAAAGGSLKFSADFETVMTRVGVLTDIGTGGVAEMRDEILRLAPTVGIGPTPLAEALLVVASTGIKGADAMQVLEAAAKASAVGLGETKDVARAVTSAMTAYGSENLNAAQASDKLFVAIRAGGAEADQFAGTLGRVVGIASQVGVSFDEVLASIATFTRLGVDAAEATTALRGVMATILKPSKDARDQLVELGTSIEELRKSVKEKGLTVALTDLVKLTKGNDDALSAIVPNVRALSGVMGTAGSQAQAYKENLVAIQGASGDLNRAFDEVSKTMGFTWNQVVAEGSKLMIQFGNAIAPAFHAVLESAKPVLGTASDMITLFTAMPVGIQTTTIALLAVAAASGPVLLAFGQIVKIVGIFTSGASLLAGGLSALGNTIPILTARLWLMEAAATTTGVALTGLATAALLIGGPIAAAIYGIVKLRELGKSGDDELAKWAESGAFGVDAYVTSLKKAKPAVVALSDAAKSLKDRMSGAGLIKSMEDLTAVTIELGNAGQLPPETMRRIAKEAQALEAQGQKLSPMLAQIVQHYGKTVEVGDDVVKSTVNLSAALKATELAVANLSDKKKADIEAGKKMGASEEDIAKAVGVSKEAVSLYIDSLAKLKKEKEDAADRKWLNGVYEYQMGVEAQRMALEGFISTLHKLPAAYNDLPEPTGMGFGNIDIRSLEHERAALDGFLSGLDKSIGEHLTAPAGKFSVMNGAIASVAKSFQGLANVAGESLGAVVRDLGVTAQALTMSADAAIDFKAGMKQWSDGSKTAGFAAMAGSIMQVAGAFMAATEHGSTFAKTLKGALVGAEFGAQFGPIGAAIGAGVGGLLGLVRGLFTSAAKETEKLRDKWLESIDLGELTKRAEAAGVSLQVIFDARKPKDFEAAVKSVNKEIAAFEKEQARIAENARAFVSEFPQLLSDVAASGGLASQALLDVIDKVKGTKEMAGAVGAFVTGQIASAIGGIAAYLGTYDAANKKVADGQKELGELTKKLSDLDKEHGTDYAKIANSIKTKEVEVSQLKQRLAKADGDEQKRIMLDIEKKEIELGDLRSKLAAGDSDERKKILDRIKEINAELETQKGIMSATAVTSTETAGVLASVISAAFIELQKGGMSATDALEKVKPAVLSLQARLMELGIDGGDAFKQLIDMVKISEDKIAGPALNAVQGLTGALVGLHNSGMLNQQTFVGLANQITQTYQSLIKQGYDGDTVMRLMQPSLQKIWELQHDFGYVVDAATQKLLDQGIAAGIVGDKHRSAQDRIATAMERVAKLLEDFIKSLSKDLPQAADDAAGDVIDSIGTIDDAIETLQQNPFDGWHVPDIDFPDPPEWWGQSQGGGGGGGGGNSGGGGGDGQWSDDARARFIENNGIADIGRWDGFATGTPGLGFVDFGDETPVFLHGREAVVPEGQAGAFADRHGSGDDLREELAALRHTLRRLVADQPRATARAIKDALALARGGR